MIGFNHALTGALIARFLPLPIALPAALASHFILDTMPHYGMPHHQRDNSKFWKIFFTCDALITFSLVPYSLITHHYAMLLGGFVAVMPDFIWVGRVIRTRSFDLSNNTNWFTRWHVGIQKLERPWGKWVELPVAALLFYVVLIKLW
ncbi:MAG TPA: hypothetical protein VFL85_03605 [Candidatus Saccharimonadales bacterium]|nr:hypothetical protein [Candidatus Saccharimonadales bacterium]